MLVRLDRIISEMVQQNTGKQYNAVNLCYNLNLVHPEIMVQYKVYKK